MSIMNLVACTLLLSAGLTCISCSEQASHSHTPEDVSSSSHTHADGTRHANHGTPPVGPPVEHDHAHEEVPLESAVIDGMTVELAQSHGPLTPGQESHLVIKLPYNDGGQTIVRAWIGSEDRTLSFVGKGQYAPSHDDYDLHALAPDPLSPTAMWWVEIERPDGSRSVGSAQPIR